MVTYLREYVALHSLKASKNFTSTTEMNQINTSLVKEILNPYNKISHFADRILPLYYLLKIIFSYRLPETFQNHINNDLNESQLSAVNAACQKIPSPFVLLQGPPVFFSFI